MKVVFWIAFLAAATIAACGGDDLEAPLPPPGGDGGGEITELCDSCTTPTCIPELMAVLDAGDRVFISYTLCSDQSWFSAGAQCIVTTMKSCDSVVTVTPLPDISRPGEFSTYYQYRFPYDDVRRCPELRVTVLIMFRDPNTGLMRIAWREEHTVTLQP